MPKYVIEIADIKYRHVCIDAPSREAVDEWWDLHGDEQDDELGTVFEAVGDDDQRFIDQMRQWFPKEHRIWRHIKTDEEP